MATIGVEDIHVAGAAYCSALGYELAADGRISEAYAKIWGHEGVANRPVKLLRPSSGTPVFIRLIEADEDVGVRSPRPGWFALEICVKDLSLIHI